MHAHDVSAPEPKQSCWGFFVVAVTAEEHAPMTLETEIKAGSYSSWSERRALIRPATTMCCRSPSHSQEEGMRK